jgi:hypothetical protein
MIRTLVYFYVGVCCGLLVLAGCGAWVGYTGAYGRVAGARVEAAVLCALNHVSYWWLAWPAAAVGGVVGALAGLGTCFVRRGTAARCPND